MRGVAILLSGTQARETGQALGERLIELGRMPERLDDAWAERLGGATTVDAVCRLLSRNGVIVREACENMHCAPSDFRTQSHLSKQSIARIMSPVGK